LAVIAEPATSEAKRAITVPFALGVIIPSISAILLPVVPEEVLQLPGTLYVVNPSLFVLAVVVDV
jgi:hypothetical protein